MPVFVNKPRQIEAVELVPGVAMPEGVLVRATTDAPGSYEVYNELHDSWIKTKAGDMIRVDKAPTDCYPIDRETFDGTYEAADGAPSVPFPFDDEIDFILGQPNFVAGSYARTLRKGGHVIPTKAEKEQAAVAYWMLGLYLEHGAVWREVANAELVAIDAAHRASERAAARAAAGPDA